MYSVLKLYSEVCSEISLSYRMEEGGILSEPVLEVGDKIYSDSSEYLYDLYEDICFDKSSDVVNKFYDFLEDEGIDLKRDLIVEITEMLCYFKIKGVI